MVMVSRPSQYPGDQEAWALRPAMALLRPPVSAEPGEGLHLCPSAAAVSWHVEGGNLPLSAHSRDVTLNTTNPHHAPTWEKLPVVASREVARYKGHASQDQVSLLCDGLGAEPAVSRVVTGAWL